MGAVKWMKNMGNGALAGNLLSLSLAKQPRKLLKYVSECAFLYRSIADNRGVPQKHVFETVLHEGELHMVLPTPLQGNKWFSDLPFLAVDMVSLCLLCRLFKPNRIFEIGAFDGYSAAAMAMNSPAGAVVYSLDLPREPRRMTWEGTAVEEKVIPLAGDSAKFDFSPYRENIDLFFVDGAHSYEYALCDTRSALLCTRPGGVIVWHDFGKLGCTGVERAIRELAGGKQIFAVPGGSLAYAAI